MSKAALCATSTVSLREGVEGRQHGVDGRLAGDHLRRDAVDGDRRRRDAALRVDQLLEALAAQQPAVDDARGADLDDLVAAGRVQARGLGVEHGVGQLDQRPVVERTAAARRRRTGRSRSTRAGCRCARRPRGSAPAPRVGASGSRKRKKASWRTRSRSNQNSPPWRCTTSRTVSALRLGAGAAWRPSPSSSRSRCSSPGRPRPGRGGRAAPVGGAQPQAARLDLELVAQAQRQVGQRLQQRKAVELEPQCAVDVRRAGAQPGERLDAPLRGLRRSRRPASPPAASAWPGPARSARPGRRCARTSPATSSRTTPRKRSRSGASSVGVVEHLGRGAQVGQRAAAAFGQPVQQPVARGLVARSRA